MTRSSPDDKQRVLGAILAGGQARRFGSDKGLALLAGRSLAEHVAAHLGAQVDRMITVGRSYAGLVAIPDRPAAGLGPLGAINAALHHARDAGFDAVLSAPCDAPLLPPDLRRQLAAPGGAARLGDMPVVGYWPIALADGLDAWLAAAPSRSVARWADAIGAAKITLAGQLINVNTPEDLAALTRAYSDWPSSISITDPVTCRDASDAK